MKVHLLFALVFSLQVVCSGQNGMHSLYTNDMKVVNPAYTGLSNDQTFSAIHKSALEGNSSKTTINYDRQIKSIAGAAGFIFSNETNGPTSFSEITLLYNQKINLPNSRLIAISIAPKYARSNIDFDAFLPVDDADPLFISNTSLSNAVLDTDIGVLYQSGKTVLGLSVTNLTNSKIKYEFEFLENGRLRERDRRLFNLSVEQWLDMSNWLSIQAIALGRTNLSENQLDLNMIFELKKTVIIGSNYQVFDNRTNIYSIIAGIKVKRNFRLTGIVYSNRFQDFADNTIGTDFEMSLQVHINN